MAKLPTVTIWDKGRGKVRINESDYDPDQHNLYDGEPEVIEPEAPVEPDVGDDPEYRVEYNAPWYSIVGREEGKIGKSTRDEDEAYDRLRALLADKGE